MHPNPIFRQTGTQNALDFAKERAFGILTTSSTGAPLIAHLPFLLSQDGNEADMHLMRSNPICRAAQDGQTASLIISGPDGYVSPDWYEIDDQVPTWNYIAVHLTGALVPLPAENLDALLARQSAFYEARLAPKPPWTMDKMTAETRARFLRMILPFRLHIEEVQSTWKLGQNKPNSVRMNAASKVHSGFGSDLYGLAEQMMQPPKSE